MVRPDEVRHVAKLARMQLSDGEVEAVALQLGRILEYVELLEQVEDEETPVPTSERPDAAPPLRADEPGEVLPRDTVLGQAPMSDGETFLVPPVIEGGGAA